MTKRYRAHMDNYEGMLQIGLSPGLTLEVDPESEFVARPAPYDLAQEARLFMKAQSHVKVKRICDAPVTADSLGLHSRLTAEAPPSYESLAGADWRAVF